MLNTFFGFCVQTQSSIDMTYFAFPEPIFYFININFLSYENDKDLSHNMNIYRSNSKSQVIKENNTTEKYNFLYYKICSNNPNFEDLLIKQNENILKKVFWKKKMKIYSDYFQLKKTS